MDSRLRGNDVFTSSLSFPRGRALQARRRESRRFVIHYFTLAIEKLQFNNEIYGFSIRDNGSILIERLIKNG